MGRRSPAAEIRATIHNPMRRAIYLVVARIPLGKVATYGQVATTAGYPGRARQVGYALAGMPEGLDLPWHRVINTRGQESPRRHSLWHEFQYHLLKREGVAFEDHRVDLDRYGWQPWGRRPVAASRPGRGRPRHRQGAPAPRPRLCPDGGVASPAARVLQRTPGSQGG